MAHVPQLERSSEGQADTKPGADGPDLFEPTGVIEPLGVRISDDMQRR